MWLIAGDEATREPLFLVTLGLCDSRADERLVGEGMAPESYNGEEGIPTFPSELLAASMYLSASHAVLETQLARITRQNLDWPFTLCKEV